MEPTTTTVGLSTLGRVRFLEAQLQGEPFLTDPDWLMLPVGTQEMALRRLSALRAYDKLDKPTAKDALRLASASGVGIARFYQLVAHWRANDRSPLSLVSLGSTERRTRMPAVDTAETIRDAISDVLVNDPLTPTADLIRQVRKSWTGPGDLPSDAALRVFHDRALRTAERLPGSLSFRLGGQAKSRAVTAERLGAAIVVDHVSVKGLLEEETLVAPTVTLAIDLWSSRVLGATAVLGPPSPRSVVTALGDAARRIAEHQTGSVQPSNPVPPVIVMATTGSPQWGELRERLNSAGFEIVDREDEPLHVGNAARLLLGLKLGRLNLEKRLSPSPGSGVNLLTHAVQPLKTIDRILADTIDGILNERVPADAWTSATTFAVPSIEGVEAKARTPSAGRMKRTVSDPRMSEGVGQLLYWMAERIVADDGTVEIHRSDDLVWHVAAKIGDAAVKEALFNQLAKGAMEVSSVHHIPVVVDVDVVTQEG